MSEDKREKKKRKYDSETDPETTKKADVSEFFKHFQKQRSVPLYVPSDEDEWRCFYVQN